MAEIAVLGTKLASFAKPEFFSQKISRPKRFQPPTPTSPI